MNFETKKEVLDWYERQERVLTPEYLSNIPWHEVKDHPIDERFVPVLLYMRDVESLTDMYQQEMMRTPTGKDPHIRKFMERWVVEEATHGEVLDRFLNEIGVESDVKWKKQVRRSVSRAYGAQMYLITLLTNLVGKRFTATHMTFGAIHEMETTQGYRRVIELADHPVLTQILQAIIREESAHTHFYRGVARLELKRSEFARRMARFVIDHFWLPVGQGSVPAERAAYVVSTLFGDEAGIGVFDKTVTQRVRDFPGFENVTKITETIGMIVDRSVQIETA